MKYRYIQENEVHEGLTEDKIVINECLYDSSIGKYLDISTPNKAVAASDSKVISYLMTKHTDLITHGNVDALLVEIMKERHFRNSDIKKIFKYIIDSAKESENHNVFLSNLNNISENVKNELSEISDFEELVLYCLRNNSSKTKGKIDITDMEPKLSLYANIMRYSVYKGFSITSMDILLTVEDVLEKNYNKLKNGVYTPKKSI